MQLTGTIHVLTINFKVPLPAGAVTRSVRVTLICHGRITLIDSGVMGCEREIFDYIHGIGRSPGEIDTLILTHSHPDHIGAARAIVDAVGCRVMAHETERAWIEDVELQARQRPVPGFHTLVGGSVAVNRCVVHGDALDLGGGMTLAALHTPGHSAGSISLWQRERSVLICGDAVPVPGEMPVFEDYAASLASLEILARCDADLLISSWADPVRGPLVAAALDSGNLWLRDIASTVRSIAGEGRPEPMRLCRDGVARLGLTSQSVNPLVTKSFMSCLMKRKGE